MHIIAEAKVVVYTPAEDFLYNSDTGAALMVILISFIVTLTAGYVTSAAFRHTTAGRVLGCVAALVVLALGYALIKY